MRQVNLGRVRVACGAEILDQDDVNAALERHEAGRWSALTEWIDNWMGKGKVVYSRHEDRYNTRFLILTIEHSDPKLGRITHVCLGHRLP